MLEIIEADQRNVPIIVWYILSQDIENGWKCISRTEIELKSNNSTWVTNDLILDSNIWEMPIVRMFKG